MREAAGRPRSSPALLFDQPKTSAATLLDALNSGGFRASALALVRAAEEMPNSPTTTGRKGDSDAGIKSPKSSRKKAASDAGIKAGQTVAAPKAKKTKPPAVAGYVWRSDGEGWQLRQHVNEPNGKRRQIYVAYLSKKAFRQMKKQHKSAHALADALTVWAKEL